MGLTDGYSPAHSSAQYNKKFQWVKNLIVKKNILPLHFGDNKKIVALHLSPSCHPPPYPVGGGGWVGAVVANDWCISNSEDIDKMLQKLCQCVHCICYHESDSEIKLILKFVPAALYNEDILKICCLLQS